MMNTKRQIIGSLLSLLFIVGTFGMTPANVHAQAASAASAVTGVVVTDPGHTAVTSYISGIKTEELTITSILNGLVWAAAGAVIQGMTRSLVNWINSGFEGSPAFAQDIDTELRMWTDGIVDRFIEVAFTEISQEIQQGLSSIEGNLNLPFRVEILNDARVSYYRRSSSNYFHERTRPTLGQYSSNPAAFLQGDFDQGGWQAWFAVLQRPNNPYGYSQLVRQEIDARVAAGERERETEILIGDGFLGFRRCSGASGSGSTGSGTTGTTASGGTANLSSSNKQSSPGCTISTPGSLARDAAPETFRVAFDRLNLADSINEIVGALVSQLVSQIFSSNGFLSLSQPNYGGRSFVDLATDPSNQPGVNTNNNTNTNGGGGAVGTTTVSRNNFTRQETEDFRDNWMKIQAAATSTKDTLLALKNCYETNSIALGILAMPQVNDNLEEVEDILEEAEQRIAQADAVLLALDTARTAAEEDESIQEEEVLGINDTLIANAHVQSSENPELGSTLYRVLITIEAEAAEDLLVCQD